MIATIQNVNKPFCIAVPKIGIMWKPIVNLFCHQINIFGLVLNSNFPFSQYGIYQHKLILLIKMVIFQKEKKIGIMLK